MRCPFATWRPISANHGGPMRAHVGLVLHVQVGYNSLFAYFNNPKTQASSHFWAAKDGTLEQYVDTDLTAWAQAAGNPTYLSVETEGLDTEPLTLDQVEIVAALLDWSAGVYGFPIAGPVAHGASGFTPHCNPDGTPDPLWGNHSCPGKIRLGQMPEIVARATPPLPNESEGPMTSVVLPNGKVIISAAGAGTRAEHLLIWTFDPAVDKILSVVDATAGISDPNPYLVA